MAAKMDDSEEFPVACKVKHDFVGRKSLCSLKRNHQRIPQAALDVRDLEVLDLSWNPLQEIREEICHLQKLSVLRLTSCELQKFPKELCQLLALQELILTENRIREVPDEISQLTNLRTLYLGANKFKELPKSVCSVKSLEVLCMPNNKIKLVPSEIKTLQNLSTLDLANNRLEGIPLAASKIPQLRYFNLANNCVTDLPKEVGGFPKITAIIFGKSEIISKLSVKGGVSIAGRQMSFRTNKSTKAKVLQYVNRQGLVLSNNPVEPPAELSRETIQVILQYVKAMKKSSAVKTRRKKLLVLGETLAGKTSLVNALLTGKSELTKDTDRTKVVDQYMWDPTDQLHIQVSDFGGHDIYTVTHPFFLSRNAIVLLVFSLHAFSAEKYMSYIGSWLQILKAFAPQVKLFMVGTHADQLSDEKVRIKCDEVIALAKREEKGEVAAIQAEIDNISDKISKEILKPTKNRPLIAVLDQKKAEMENLLLNRLVIPDKIFVTSSGESLYGVGHLKDAILEDVAQTGILLPDSWFDFTRRMGQYKAGNPDRYLSWDVVQDCYKESFGLPVKLVSIVKGKSAQIYPVMQYLHDVGDVLWYGKNSILCKTVFHQPHFLVHMLKLVFRHDMRDSLIYDDSKFQGKFTKASFDLAKEDFLKRGLLSKKLLLCLWSESQVDNKTAEMLIELFKMFDLCYETLSESEGSEKERLLHFPWFLSQAAPESIQTNWPKIPPRGVLELRLELHFPMHYPLNFYEKLAVRLQKYLKHHKCSRIDWKDGVYAQINTEKVLLKRHVDASEDRIQFAVRGTDIVQLWQVLQPVHCDAKDLLRQAVGNHCDIFMACVNCIRHGVRNPQLHMGEYLDQPCPTGLTHIHCPKCQPDGSCIPAAFIYPIQKDKKGYQEHQTLVCTFLETSHLEAKVSPPSRASKTGLVQASGSNQNGMSSMDELDGGLHASAGHGDPTKPEDVVLQQLADNLGFEWEKVGICLGVSTGQIDQCKMEHPHYPVGATLAMLKKWRLGCIRMAPEEKTKMLINALKLSDRNDLAEQVQNGGTSCKTIPNG